MPYDNSMRGVLFPNDRKTTDKHPDYKGNGEVNGTEVWISAWVKQSQAGQSYLSISFENKDESQVGQGRSTVTPAALPEVPIDSADFNTAPVGVEDEIPF